MSKNKSSLWFSITFLCLLGTVIGFSSFVVFGANKTHGDITHDDETTTFHDVNVHYETLAEGMDVTYEYYVPKEYTISHGITCYDASGNPLGTQEMSAPSNGTLTNPDPIQLYDDVYEGVRTRINRRSNSQGPEQIRSFKCDVLSWEQVADAQQYTTVWQMNVTDQNGNEDYLRFQCDSGNVGTHGQQYSIGDIYISDQFVSKNTEVVNGTYVTDIVYQRITIYNVAEIVYGNVEVACVPVNYATWVYYPQYEMRMIRIISTTDNPVFVDSNETVKVKDNSFISPIDLNIVNYTNYGYFKDLEYSEYFDFNEPITSDTDIYLRYIESSNYIASSISNLNGESLSLHDVYRSGSGAGINVGEDMTYHVMTNSVFIDSATINSGSTLNLTYGNDEIAIEPKEGSTSDNLGVHRATNDYAIAPDYNGTNPLQYCGYDAASIHIILNGDLVIDGTLNIGGEVGGRSASTFYSYIIGRYAYLDLHGHNIIINNGGVLNNYGLIKDTIGGGKIIVNDGGKLMTTVTVADARGRDQSVVGLSKRQCLFTEYNTSYLQVPCVFYKGSTLDGYCKIDFQELGIVNTNITFIGNTLNEALFSFDSSSSSKDYVYYEPYKIASLSTPSNGTIYTKMYNCRSRFTFNANMQEAGSYVISANISSNYGDISADFDFARVDFPISPLFDFVINNGYTLELNSKMTFYPGSSLYSMKGSTISFKSTGYKTYDKVSATGDTMAISGESRYIAGGIMSYSSNIRDLANYNYGGNRFSVGVYSQTTYWNYVKPNNIILDGNLTFDSSIDTSYSDGRYYLSGKMSISNEGVESIINNRNYLQSYDSKAELYGGFFYNNTSQDLSGQYQKATSFNINPLILNDVSYILDSNHNLKGTFDTTTGIFTCNDGDYFLQMDTDLYTDGSSESNQGSTIDRNITIKQISQFSTNYKIIKDIDSNLYVYYCGIYVPITDARYTYGDTLNNGYNLQVNLRKFHSNRDNDTYKGNIVRYSYDSQTGSYVAQAQENQIVLSPLYDNCLIYYSTSSKQWTFRGFIK